MSVEEGLEHPDIIDHQFCPPDLSDSTRLKRMGEKCQKTTPTALIISTFHIDISIYSLDVLVFVSITYTAQL